MSKFPGLEHPVMQGCGARGPMRASAEASVEEWNLVMRALKALMVLLKGLAK